MGAALAKSNPFTGAIQTEYEFNKDMANRVEKDALFNAAQRRKAGDRLMKEQGAAYAGAGVELEGTALDVMQEDLKNAEMEAMNIVYTGKVKSKQMKTQAKFQRNNAYTQLGMSLGTMALMGGVGKGGGAGAMEAEGTFAGTQGSNIPRSTPGTMIA